MWALYVKVPSWLSWIKWQSNISKVISYYHTEENNRIFLWKSDIYHPSLLTNVHGRFILMSCFILIATLPPRRFCPSWDPNTPSLRGSATSSLRASKWCLSLISWNIPELSDSKLLWGGTVRKPLKPSHSPGCDTGETPAGEAWNCTQAGNPAKRLWGCHTTESVESYPLFRI